jgi:hypothetical protein
VRIRGLVWQVFCRVLLSKRKKYFLSRADVDMSSHGNTIFRDIIKSRKSPTALLAQFAGPPRWLVGTTTRGGKAENMMTKTVVPRNYHDVLLKFSIDAYE